LGLAFRFNTVSGPLGRVRKRGRGQVPAGGRFGPGAVGSRLVL